MDTKNNPKQTSPLQIRQGDVLLNRISSEITKPVKPVHGMLIVGGEKTGQFHCVLAEYARLLLHPSGAKTLKVKRPTPLMHQEHATVRLDPGTYLVNEITGQTEPGEIRQGDLLLSKFSPMGEIRVKPVSGMLILAKGEMTGHFHGVPAEDARLSRNPFGGMTLEVLRPTPLVHEEHALIRLEPGTYDVSVQREYDPRGDDYLIGD